MSFEEEKKKVLRDYLFKLNPYYYKVGLIKILDLINENPSYYTTSSCSGRITIDIFYGEKKRDHIWLFKKHDLFSFEEFFNVLLKIK